jgi:hypothetical protein
LRAGDADVLAATISGSEQVRAVRCPAGPPIPDRASASARFYPFPLFSSCAARSVAKPTTADLKIEPAVIETFEVLPDPGSCRIDGEHSSSPGASP